MKRRLASGRTSLRGFKKKCVNQVGKGTQLVPACPCLPRSIGDLSGIYRECFTELNGVSQFTILPIYRGSIRGFTPMLRTKIIITSWR